MTKTELQTALATATNTDKRTAGVFLETLSGIAYREIKKNGEFVLPGGTRHKGINLILLMGRSWEDPRWMTYKQAQENLQTAEMYQDAAMDWGSWDGWGRRPGTNGLRDRGRTGTLPT
jgi:hypothetical protein